MRFIKLIDPQGDPVFINTDHIVSISIDDVEENTTCITTVDNGFTEVIEPPLEILNLITCDYHAASN